MACHTHCPPPEVNHHGTHPTTRACPGRRGRGPHATHLFVQFITGPPHLAVPWSISAASRQPPAKPTSQTKKTHIPPKTGGKRRRNGPRKKKKLDSKLTRGLIVGWLVGGGGLVCGAWLLRPPIRPSKAAPDDSLGREARARRDRKQTGPAQRPSTDLTDQAGHRQGARARVGTRRSATGRFLDSCLVLRAWGLRFHSRVANPEEFVRRRW